MDNTALQTAIASLGELLTQKQMMLGTAESCTGGQIASLLTDVSGSSGWFAGAVVSYANEVKQNVLGVPAAVLEEQGAVSESTVLAMVQGAQRVLGVQCAVAISGVAGPTGGTPDKPVGTVWMAFAINDATVAKKFHFGGGREAVRRQSAHTAILTILSMIEKESV